MVETRRRRRPKTNASNTASTSAQVNDQTSENLPGIDTENQPKASSTDVETKAGEDGMSMELLEEVFKRTSAFTVRGAMMDEFDLEVMDDIELWEAEAGDGILAEWEEEEDYITLHLDDDALDDEFGVVPRRRRYQKTDGSKRSGTKLSSRDQIIQRYKYMQVRVQDRHGHTFFVSRKVNAIDPSMPTYVRIPPKPIPRSWVKHIRPLSDENESTPRTVISGVLYPKSEPQWSRRIDTDVTLDYDFSSFDCTFQCVYMDPPLLLPEEDPKLGYFDIGKLTAVPVNKLLVPGAFLFTWCEKELIPDMCEMAERQWGLKYVENFCWVRQLTNNHIARLESPFFRRSKVTLLIFRKEGNLEMRHQRSPDSVFDFIKPRMPGDLNDRKPEFAYTVIETLLPLALCSDEQPNPDRLLQLWMPADFSAIASMLDNTAPSNSINEAIPSLKAQIRVSNQGQDILALFAAYSGAAYSVTNQWNCSFACQHPGAEDTIIEHHWGLGFPISAGYIARNPPGKFIVVAFQGTNDDAQWLDNLDVIQESWPMEVPGSRVHSGFLRGYLDVQRVVVDKLRELALQYPDYSIAIVGHSLGGARAALCLLDISIKLPQLLPRLYLYTQGQPRTGNKEFADAIDKLEAFKYRCVYEYDPAPRVPLISMDYHHHSTETWYHKNQTFLCVDPVADNSCIDKDDLNHPFDINDHYKYPGLKH
ncbi:hypothetical protein H4R22_000904 [Coemansia sp. RSA 1290]|nr:hypothetical protein H4R22_000904 [Coemansia sp. RSA 1290]